MKKVLALLVALSMMFIACACSASAGQVQVMTSFYPLYIFALNVFDGVDGVTGSCMTTPSTGCLHDYQLLASDMMKLAKADMLIVCGAGMENYLGDVQAQFPNLPVVDCSAGIDLMSMRRPITTITMRMGKPTTPIPGWTRRMPSRLCRPLCKALRR